MAITLTLTSNITENKIAYNDLPKTVNLTAVAVDSIYPGALFNYSWYIIDLPTDSTATLTSAGGATTSFDADVWGSYRVFCIAENQATEETSNTNPFSAPLTSFIDISVLSEKYELEKPARSQRNWHDKYWKLVDTVENLSADSATFLESGISQIASPYHVAKGSDPSLSTSGEDYLVLSADSFYQSLLPTAGGSVPTSADNLMRERLKDVALEQINESSINELADVVITSPVLDNILKYDGSNWINSPATTVTYGLDNLSDVTITTPSDDQILMYSGGEWINSTLTDAVGATVLDELNDVIITTPSADQFLQYDGHDWINATVNIPTVLDDLTDVNASSPFTGDFLRYSSGQWINEAVTIPTTLDNLTDVIVSLPTSNQFLQYNGANWVNASVTIPTLIDDLSDVVLSTPVSKQVLKYNGSNWINGAAVDGLSSDGSSTLTVATGYKVLPTASAQDLGSTTARWDVFGVTGNFSSNVTITGQAIFNSFSTINDDGPGNMQIDFGGSLGVGGGSLLLKGDTVVLEPTQKATGGFNPKVVMINEHDAEFAIKPQSKTTIDLGIQLPSDAGAQGQYIKVDSVTGNDMVLEYANITARPSFNSYIDGTLTNFSTLTYSGTTDGSTVTSGLPTFASGAICAWKNNTGKTIALTGFSAFILNQRSLTVSLALAKATSDINMRDSNFTHIGTEVAITNNSGSDNTLGAGLSSALISDYVIPAGYWIVVTKIANGGTYRTDNYVQLQLDYKEVL